MQDIKKYLSYDPETGIFTRLQCGYNLHLVNKPAGWKTPSGHVRVKYKLKTYSAHRLAWYFYYGELPLYNIDHINENPSDNRILNLRLDTSRENEQNISTLRIDNTSGYKGVSWNKLEGKWKASIYAQGKQLSLGSFKSPEEASKAYLIAKRKYHPFWVENK